MVCPACKNKGFVKSEKTPVRNRVYAVEQYDTVTLRRRICLQCGYKWRTTETIEEERND